VIEFVRPISTKKRATGQVTAEDAILSPRHGGRPLGEEHEEEDTEDNPEAAGSPFFARDAAVIGKTLGTEGHPVTVIGVLPPGMRFPQVALAPKIAFQETARDALLFQPLAPSERDLNADMATSKR
jgi:hypothetical protein